MQTACRGALALFALTVLASLEFQAADEPKYTTDEVMQMAHKGGLLKKVVEGKPTKKDKEDLLEMYVALSKNKPSKGPEKSWKDMTTAIVSAAKSVVADEKGAPAKLKKAVNCNGCHDTHRD